VPRITLTISEEVEVPEGTQIVLAPTGVISGLRLPDGTFLKPCTSYEMYAPGEENGDPQGDADTVDLTALEVHVGLDYDRQIEVTEGKLETDESQVSVDWR